MLDGTSCSFLQGKTHHSCGSMPEVLEKVRSCESKVATSFLRKTTRIPGIVYWLALLLANVKQLLAS